MIGVHEEDLCRLLNELAHLRTQRDTLQADNTRLLEMVRAKNVQILALRRDLPMPSDGGVPPPEVEPCT